LSLKKSSVFIFLVIATVSLAVNPPPSSAQFIPCRVVNLNLIPPTSVQAGQPFQITTNLTVYCDPSILPIIRVTLVDATSLETLSTTTLPYYPTSTSFVASVTNQATARQITGSWALEVQVNVINGLSGRAVASSAQLFQVDVEPYVTSATLTQTTAMTTNESLSLAAATTQFIPPTTVLQNLTETTESTPLSFSTQLATSPSTGNEYLIPAVIVLIGLLIFGSLAYLSRRANRRFDSQH